MAKKPVYVTSLKDVSRILKIPYHRVVKHNSNTGPRYWTRQYGQTLYKLSFFEEKERQFKQRNKKKG